VQRDGGRVVEYRIRGAVMCAKAVIALWRYHGVFTLSGGQGQSRVKKRYGLFEIFPHAACGWQWGENVDTVFGRWCHNS